MPKFQETDDFVVDLRTKNASQPVQQPAAEGVTTEASEQENAYAYELPAEPSRSVWHFMQYNNSFLVLLLIGVMTFSGLAFASEEVRSETLGSKKVEAQGVDNTVLIDLDLENFTMDFEITGILENDEQYLISYSFVDFDVVSGAWQYVEKTATRRIKKPFRQDLGIYLARQLSQEESARLKELRQAQKDARNEGETKLVEVTHYSGLIGKVLDVANQVFPGYEPVKTVTIPTPPLNQRLQDRSRSGVSDSMTNVYNEWVENNPDLLNNLNGDGATPETSTTTTDTATEPETSTTTAETTSDVPEGGEAAPADGADTTGADPDTTTSSDGSASEPASEPAPAESTGTDTTSEPSSSTDTAPSGPVEAPTSESTGGAAADSSSSSTTDSASSSEGGARSGGSDTTESSSTDTGA